MQIFLAIFIIFSVVVAGCEPALPCDQNITCPEGVRPMGNPPPKGTAQWCESVEGRRQGPAIFHDSSGQCSIVSYFNGQPNGNLRTYSSDGLLESILELEDGIKNGLWIVWHSNGVKKTSGRFINGLRDGHWKIWHKNGQLKLNSYYQNGKRTSTWTEWNETGQLVNQVNYPSNLATCPPPAGNVDPDWEALCSPQSI
jgi:hypothetical protein